MIKFYGNPENFLMNMNIDNLISYLSLGASSFILGVNYASARNVEKNASTDAKVTSVAGETFSLLNVLLQFVLIGIMVYRFVKSFFRNENKIFRSLNDEITKNPSIPIIGKQVDTHLNFMQRIFTCPHKDAIRSVLIIGPCGVGKSSLVKEFVRRLLSDSSYAPNLKRDTMFWGFRCMRGTTIYKFEITDILQGTKFLGSLQERIAEMKNFMRKHIDDDIFFMDEFHQLNNDQSVNNRSLPDYFKDVLTEGVRLIGATTEEEYQHFIHTNKAFADRFFVIRLEEPSDNETSEQLMSIKGKYERYGMTYDQSTIEYLVKKLKTVEGHFPRKATKFLDSVSSQWNGNSPHMLTKEDINKGLKLWDREQVSQLPYYT